MSLLASMPNVLNDAIANARDINSFIRYAEVAKIVKLNYTEK